MKNILLLFISMILLSSCGMHKKFIIKGTPGTIIYDNSDQIAVLDKNGQAKIKLSNGKYTPILFATNPDTKVTVPFALDYKNKNRTGIPRFFCDWILGLPTLTITHWMFILAFPQQGSADYDYLKIQQTNNDLVIDNN